MPRAVAPNQSKPWKVQTADEKNMASKHASTLPKKTAHFPRNSSLEMFDLTMMIEKSRVSKTKPTFEGVSYICSFVILQPGEPRWRMITGHDQNGLF